MFQNFEEVRAELNHDRLKNEFLFTMGYETTVTHSPRRGDIMRAALSGESKRVAQIRRGSALWRTLSVDLREFITELSPRFGLVTSETYQAECQEAVAAIGTLDDICLRIEEGRFREPDIDCFWKAMDCVRTLLDDLARHRRFSELVVDIDPRLVREAYRG